MVRSWYRFTVIAFRQPEKTHIDNIFFPEKIVPAREICPSPNSSGFNEQALLLLEDTSREKVTEENLPKEKIGSGLEYVKTHIDTVFVPEKAVPSREIHPSSSFSSFKEALSLEDTGRDKAIEESLPEMQVDRGLDCADVTQFHSLFLPDEVECSKDTDGYSDAGDNLVTAIPKVVNRPPYRPTEQMSSVCSSLDGTMGHAFSLKSQLRPKKRKIFHESLKFCEPKNMKSNFNETVATFRDTTECLEDSEEVKHWNFTVGFKEPPTKSISSFENVPPDGLARHSVNINFVGSAQCTDCMQPFTISSDTHAVAPHYADGLKEVLSISSSRDSPSPFLDAQQMTTMHRHTLINSLHTDDNTSPTETALSANVLATLESKEPSIKMPIETQSTTHNVCSKEILDSSFLSELDSQMQFHSDKVNEKLKGVSLKSLGPSKSRFSVATSLLATKYQSVSLETVETRSSTTESELCASHNTAPTFKSRANLPHLSICSNDSVLTNTQFVAEAQAKAEMDDLKDLYNKTGESGVVLYLQSILHPVEPDLLRSDNMGFEQLSLAVILQLAQGLPPDKCLFIGDRCETCHMTARAFSRRFQESKHESLSIDSILSPEFSSSTEAAHSIKLPAKISRILIELFKAWYQVSKTCVCKEDGDLYINNYSVQNEQALSAKSHQFHRLIFSLRSADDE